MNEKCFCHIKDKKTGEIFVVKDKEGRAQLELLREEIKNVQPKYDVLEITENGTFDVKDYKTANVEVISEAEQILTDLIEGDLTELEIPDKATKIRAYAFYQANTLTLVVIPETVTEIGSNAFNGCSGLLEVNIPSSLTDIPSYCFSGCTALNTIELSEGVKTIGNNAFYNCKALTEINLPESLESFGESAFSSSGLIEVVIPSKITSIPKSCFAYCYGLTKVTLHNGITSIGDSAFDSCRNLTTLDIPESVTSLGKGIAQYSTSLYVPKSITNFSNTPFNHNEFNGMTHYYKGTIEDWIKIYFTPSNSNMTDNKTLVGKKDTLYMKNNSGEYYIPEEFTFPEDVTSINDGTFYNFTQLKRINLNKVQRINNYSFCNTGLTEVIIPNTVNYIGTMAFDSGSKKTFIFNRETPPTLSGTRPLGATTLIDKIFVPVGCRNAYISASGWSTYANYILEPNNITVHVPSTILNNETYTYSIDQGETWNMFTSSIINLENLTTIRFKNTTADTTIKIGNTSGGSEIGTIANAELTHNTSGDEVIYLTIA